MNTLIIDDEPLAHEVLLHHSRAHADIQIVGQYHNAAEALAFLARQSVDLILLDILMPVLSGLDMLKVMLRRPQVVLCTAYQEHALEGFELDVTDYLLKPVSAERFSRALDKVRRRTGEEAIFVKPAVQSHIAIRVDREHRKIDLDKVQCFEAYGNYVKVWLEDGCLLTAATLKNFSETLPKGRFIQVHKSFLVNKAKVVAQNSKTIRLASKKLVKIGNAYRGNLPGLWQ
ncbi:LytR/AlgR family response regulator transcription factor [Microbulbifer spongiae]|uniref:LytTR family DNA-binding domain-containing protein n=1 Tax=Microbulbifer spongiae TaxID=2944933 RepID=A0ABY9EBV0_9GAMM|nr:LytTR family DNA-binding domain-containing protein [Microbulbifer sp. MI-G]WKD50460.1 LytTR family DNA-binding domain-containing protein [Microbulbifer sp. MI-G]